MHACVRVRACVCVNVCVCACLVYLVGDAQRDARDVHSLRDGVLVSSLSLSHTHTHAHAHAHTHTCAHTHTRARARPRSSAISSTAATTAEKARQAKGDGMQVPRTNRYTLLGTHSRACTPAHSGSARLSETASAQ
ncbi:hypothetical protein PTSG_12083 [Salpingoeca rosetta]|uniref:Uncharacterized protein n=1 Tax=Salpingoeca rosetta (strain ATCC 50818 / BSB-021) TaxID=946362 RepID=F2U5H2_SALR5|nr:uncharacterized protein PTSG_12083 [Salpingoeca rosetta]EGD83188.1 hypothetical protein PTSG_12083 [Salpingoeca rosetta]|eukprot:XP_004995552.1 hypothetical protein PTSG_12083 [Salpingoeca rosetta]